MTAATARVPGQAAEGFSELYRLHWGPGVAFAYCLSRNRNDAEDLVAQAFMKILSAIQSGLGPKGPFRPYLYRAIRSCAVDHWRRDRSEYPVEKIPETSIPDPGFSWIEEAADRELAAKALRSLPVRWQDVIRLIDIHRLRPREAAPILGIEANAVSALLRRARRGLREAYLILYIGETAPERCLPFRPALARMVMSAASARETRNTVQHLLTCDACPETLNRMGEACSTMPSL